MGVTVHLSERSQALIQTTLKLDLDKHKVFAQSDNSMDCDALILWLTENNTKRPDSTETLGNEEHFRQAFLNARLLKELSHSLFGKSTRPKEKKKASYLAQIQFVLIAIAGTLVAACQGFDSIATVLVVFSLPDFIIISSGIALALMSVAVFYGFNLIQVADSLGIALGEGPKLLNAYVAQLNALKMLRKQIAGTCLPDCGIEQLARYEQLLVMVECTHVNLVKASQQFQDALNSSKIQIAQFLFSGLSGLLFFGGGFFAGQSVAVYILSLLMTTPAFWPVLGFSAVVGLAGFSVYWYIERVGLQKIISGFFGLDEEKIERLCSAENATKELNKLNALRANISSTVKLKTGLSFLSDVKEDAELNYKTTMPVDKSSEIKTNRYQFYVNATPSESQHIASPTPFILP